MDMKLPPDQLALYERIDHILWEEWDPIGIREGGGPLDEYRGYLPQVFRLALDGVESAVIAQYLDRCVTDHFGMASDLEESMRVAELILIARSETLTAR